MPILCLYFTILISALVASCHPHPHTIQLTAINESLNQSFQFIENTNALIYHSLEKKKNDIHSRYDANRWSPVAFKSRQMSQDVIGFIDTLETTLLQQHRLPEERKIALVDTLLRYKHTLTNLIPDSLYADKTYLKEEKEAFYKHLPLLIGYRDSAVSAPQSETWADTMFDQDTLLNTMVLNKLKIDIAQSENIIAHYCDRQSEPRGDYFEHFNAIISINSKIVKPGDTIELFAGMGAFSASSNPIISFNGIVKPLNEEGIAVYKVNSPHQPGKYAIPVNIEFTRPDGSKSKINRTLTYEVSPLPANQ